MDRDREIERVMQRTRRYWYEDGLTEMAVGCLFLAIGLLFLTEYVLGSPLASGISAVGLPVIVVGGSWLGRYLVRIAKERYIYPRTGYVAYRRPPGGRSRTATVAVAVMVGSLIGLLFSLAPASLAWIPALQGLLVGGFLLFYGYRLGLVRFYVLAICAVVAGTVTSLAGLGDLLGSSVFFAAFGLALLLSGLLTLGRYLRQTTPPGE